MSTHASTSAVQVLAKKATSKSSGRDSKNTNCDFHEFTATMRLPIAPVWSSSGTTNVGGAEGSGGMEGVREVLAGWVMRYLPPLQCVLLSFDPIPVLMHPTTPFPASASPFPSASSSRSRDPARLLMSPGPDEDSDDEHEPAEEKKIPLKGIPLIPGSGFALAEIEWKGLGWKPQVGQKLVGYPTLSTPSHISLLIHNLFNASIPSSHIPTDTYYFDPEYPVPASIQLRQLHSLPPIAVPVAEAVVETIEEVVVEGDEEKEDEAESSEVENEEAQKAAKPASESGMEMEVDQEEDIYREKGWWRHNTTNAPLGGEDGGIEFTVVGLTITNSMISITGSLLSKPFSVKLAPKPLSTTILSSKSSSLSKRRRGDYDSSSNSDSDSDDDDGRKSRTGSVKAPPRLSSIVRSDTGSVAATNKRKKTPTITREERNAAKKAKKESVQANKRERGQTPIGDKKERKDRKQESKHLKKAAKMKIKLEANAGSDD